MAKTALLVMDMQKSIVDNFGKEAQGVVGTAKVAVDAAHDAGILVIYIVVRFRKGYPEVSSSNKSFSAIRERFSHIALDEEGPATAPVIRPVEGDLVVSKKRVSAFAGSDLAMILAAQEISDLVLCGIATSGVVLSTLRYASDRDFRLTVLSDACLDQDEEVHRVLTQKVFPRQAEVMTVSDWQGTVKG